MPNPDSPRQPRRHIETLRLTDAEASRIADAAARRDQTRSDFIRAATLAEADATLRLPRTRAA